MPEPDAPASSPASIVQTIETKPVSPAVRSLWLHTEAVTQMLQSATVAAAMQSDSIAPAEGWQLNIQLMRWERPSSAVKG